MATTARDDVGPLGRANLRTVAELWNTTFASVPDRDAIRDGDRVLTYRQLEAEARRVASWLAEHGVMPGDRVLMVSRNRAEYLVVEAALALGGFTRVAVGHRLHPSEVAAIIDDARPSCAFIEASWLDEADRDFKKSLPTLCVLIGFNPTVDTTAILPDAVKFEGLVADGAATELAYTPAPDDVVWLLYTSGSTGKPKGVVHTHTSVLAMVRNIRWALGKDMGAGDVAVHTAPLPHMSGAVALTIASLGGTNVPMSSFVPLDVIELIERERATVLPLVPTQLMMLTAHLERSPADVSRLRAVPYAGSAIVPERLERAVKYLGHALVQFYGSSEILMPMAALTSADHVMDRNEMGLPRAAAAGRAVPGVEITIRRLDGSAAPPGEVGEVVVRSPAACREYWNNAEATHEVFEPDGFVHTGDVGMLDSSGYLFIVDRQKDMVISGGFNVYPREVENVLATMPEVAEVAVIGTPDDTWGEAVTAVIVSSGATGPSLSAVQGHCRKSLAGYKIPRHIVLRPELPKVSNGKIAKKALTEEFWAGIERRVGG